MKDTMDETSAVLVSTMANEISVPDGCMMPLLIASTAHHLNGSEIEVIKTWKEPSIIFAAVIGYPGTNKSR